MDQVQANLMRKTKQLCCSDYSTSEDTVKVMSYSRTEHVLQIAILQDLERHTVNRMLGDMSGALTLSLCFSGRQGQMP